MVLCGLLVTAEEESAGVKYMDLLYSVRTHPPVLKIRFTENEMETVTIL